MTMEEIDKKILAEMRNPQIYKESVVKYVEDNLEDAFNYCCRKGISINEWKPDSTFGKQVNEKTVLITVRMFDLWENAVIEILNQYLSKKFNGVRVEHSHDSLSDLKIYFPDGAISPWEVKSSQAKDSWTGATHSSAKSPHFILINYEIDKDMKLKTGSNKGFVKELAIFVWDNMDNDLWLGEPSKKSSWTTLKIPSNVKRERPEIIVVGNLMPKQKWCEVIRENLRQPHIQNFK